MMNSSTWGRSGSRRRPAAVAAATALAVVVGAATALPASAETVYELEGEWAAGTPETVSTGDAVSARWWFNLNDDAQAPGNEPVDNVTATFTATGAIFDEIPDLCLTDGVEPVSAISEDGTELVCNIGTQDEGSAVSIRTGLEVTAASGEPVGLGATIADQAVDLPPLAVANDFVQDIRWETSLGGVSQTDGGRQVSFPWTVFHGTGSPDGPDEVTYELTMSNTHSASMIVGTDACAAFTSGTSGGHPYSGGDHGESRIAPFVENCTLVQTGDFTFDLTLSGIDYSKTTVPTQDSNGNLLPTDRQAVASGTVQFLIQTSEGGGTVSLSSSAPTYEAVDGSTFDDDASNNASENSWLTGYYNSDWIGGGAWNDVLRLAPSEEAVLNISHNLNGVSGDLTDAGFCTIYDNEHVTYVPGTAAVTTFPGADVLEGAQVQYFTGSAPALTPGATYDPNSWEGCGASAGWTDTQPEDPSQVLAVRAFYDPNSVGRSDTVRLRSTVQINDDVANGQDVWQWGGNLPPMAGSTTWNYAHRGTTVGDQPGHGVLTPDSRYPFSANGRSVMRVVGTTPNVSKSVDSSSIDPGGSATYTLTYSADGSDSVPDTINGYELLDTLPEGVQYVAGSADPEPTVDTIDGAQVLTWTLDGVPTNTQNTLSYDVTFDDELVGGDRLVNTVVASSDGVSTSPATASVTVSDSGLTQIIKTEDQAFIPNVSGDGVGEGSWTVQVISQDPLAQEFTDTIDVLPYVGDGRGTEMADGGSYVLSGPVQAEGATVYYTTADPASISDDPADPSNGAAGTIAENTIGWTEEFIAEATAVRVITGELAARDSFSFVVPILTDGLEGGDTLVNRAQGRAENTRLVMRTSAPTQIANFYSASLLKDVQDADGQWRSASDPLDYPEFYVGDTVTYRIVVENTGQGTLTGIEVDDIDLPGFGSFTIEELAPGDSASHEFEFEITNPFADEFVNTACAEADVPADSEIPPEINCDEAGIIVNGEPTHTKDLVSAQPIGDGQWEVVYEVIVENQGVPSTYYDLADELRFAAEVDVVSAEVTSAPETVELFEPAWDGIDNLIVAWGQDLPRTDDEAYSPHVYELTVIANVPMSFDIDDDGVDQTACGDGSDDSARALTNTSVLTKPDSSTEDDLACAPLPSITITKESAGNPAVDDEGQWTVDYDITVTNDGAAAGLYTVSDQLRFGDGIEVLDAVVSSAPDGVEVEDTWTGQGTDGAQENTVAIDVDLDSGQVHTYQVTVTAILDEDLDAEGPAFTCPAPGSGDTGAFANTAGVESNDLVATDEACEVPEVPTPPTPGETPPADTPPVSEVPKDDLPSTGSQVDHIALAALVLLALGGLMIGAARRRRATTHTAGDLVN